MFAEDPMSVSDRQPWAQKQAVFVDALPLRRAALAHVLSDWARDAGLALHALEKLPEAGDLPGDAVGIIIVAPSGGLHDMVALGDLVRQVGLRWPGRPLVLLSDHDDADTVILAVKAGVRGFVPTRLDPAVAVQALSFVVAGGVFFPPSALLERGLRADIAEGPGASQPNGRGEAINGHHHGLAALTARQQEVLRLLRQGSSNKVIARLLDMRESTVKVHVRQIMRKLGAANRTQAALYFAEADKVAARLAPEAYGGSETPCFTPTLGALTDPGGTRAEAPTPRGVGASPEILPELANGRAGPDVMGYAIAAGK
jgi:DNA-binding NarL/FixJ family response regulator